MKVFFDTQTASRSDGITYLHHIFDEDNRLILYAYEHTGAFSQRSQNHAPLIGLPEKKDTSHQTTPSEELRRKTGSVNRRSLRLSLTI